MVGYPKNLNTKQDYLYVMQNFSKDVWENDVKKLLENLKNWFNTGEIIEGNGITDDTHKVYIDEETGKKYQYEYKDDPNCKLRQLGFTVDEVNKFLVQ